MENSKIKISIEGPFDKTKKSDDGRTLGLPVFYSEQPRDKSKDEPGWMPFGQSKIIPGNPTLATRNAGKISSEKFTGQDIMSEKASNQWFHVTIDFEGKSSIYNMPAESFSNMIIQTPGLFVFGYKLGLWDENKGIVKVQIIPPESLHER